MSVAVRNSTSLALASRANSTLTPPTGLTNGDVLLLILVAGDSGDATPPTVTGPAGFIASSGNPYEIHQSTYATAYNLFWKVASGESGDYACTHGTADTEGRLIAFTGADLTTPLSPAPSSNTNNSSVGTGLSVTTTADGSFVLYVSVAWDGQASITPPTGTTPTFTDIHDLGGVLYVCGGVMATAGATGNKTATLQSTNNPNRVSLVAILAGAAIIVLGDYTLDFGLSGLKSLCDKIYVCSQAPKTYTEAITTYALGNNNFGAGAAFNNSSSYADGMQITSVAITAGSATAVGTVAAWAAVDTANSRLLASGPLTGGTAVTIGQSFSLSSFTIQMPRTLS